MLALFVLALGVFVLPFAFPTPPPIVTRFTATTLFSPSGDGRRDTATISVRLHEPSSVSLTINEGSRVVARVLDSPREPAGWVRARWDGRDAAGQRVPDGTYGIKLLARAGRKKFETTRRIVVDTTPPRAGRMTVASATLAGPGNGECRVTFVSHDTGFLLIEALPPGGGAAVRTFGPRPVHPDRPVQWAWNGRREGGGQVPPGLYVVRASLFDAARNQVVHERTCWVGHLTGRAVPARPAARQLVGVRLRRTDGAPLARNTSVTLALYRRTGVPGRSLGRPLGAQVGTGARGPVGRVRVRIPAGVNPAALWLLARTDDGLASAIIPLRRAP